MNFFQVAIIAYALFAVLLVMQYQLQNNTLQQTSLVVRESLGYPDETQTMPNFSLRLSDENIVVFVCMTSKPNRLENVSNAFASVPHDQRVRKILVLPQSFKDSSKDDAFYNPTVIHKLHAGNRIQILRTARDFGPLLKIWAITDPATSAKLGILRNSDSKHIFVTLDDDMYQHQDLIQMLVNTVVETNFRKVVAVETRSAKRMDKSSQTQIVGRSGVAQPARLWTSAFRGDIRDAMSMSECIWDDDACVSHACSRNLTEIVTLSKGIHWALPSSVGTNTDSPNLKSSLCEDSLGKLPIL